MPSIDTVAAASTTMEYLEMHNNAQINTRGDIIFADSELFQTEKESQN